MQSSIGCSVAGVFLGLVEARDNLSKSVASLVVCAVAGHAHLGDVAATVALFGSLNCLERHQFGVHLLLDQLDHQLLALLFSLLDHVLCLHLPLDNELVVLTTDDLSFRFDVLLLDVGLGSGRFNLVLDFSDCLLMLSVDLILPVLVLLVHLLPGLGDDGDLSKLLVRLLGDFLVDLIVVKIAFQFGILALLLHDQVRLDADFLNLALDLESVELGLLLHLLAVLSLHVLEELG